MLQHEVISKVEEIKGKFKSNWLDSEYLLANLEILGFSKIQQRYNKSKKSGIPFNQLLSVLLVLPIIGIKSIYSLSKESNAINICGKDSYYRLLSNQFINWRSILLSFVKEYLIKDKAFSTPINPVKCLIFDDTDIMKTGNTIEGISKIFNHVSKMYYFGFKLLVAGYWNGSVFIPVDFSFHRENKKKQYGLSHKQRKKQKQTPRDRKTKAFKRFQELNMKKSDMLIKMFSRVCKRKIPVDYILIDSWFTSISLINKIKTINKDTDIIGMYKYNSKLSVEEKEISIKELKNKSRKPQRCRKYNSYYHKYVTKINGVKLVVFLSKRGKNGKWHTLVSTDTSLSFTKIIEIYSIRWSIEVFFKEAKQLFNLGGCQSTNFDVLVAHTTIVLIQYLLTSIKYRIEAYESIGGMFREMQQGYIQSKLNERILAIVYKILDILEKFVESIDLNKITYELINSPDIFTNPINTEVSLN